jgi:hypothetical protein
LDPLLQQFSFLVWEDSSSVAVIMCIPKPYD